MAPALVRRDDIVTFDLDGTALDAAGRRIYLERFIHGEIYRARPDVQSVVHSHSPSVIPFGVTGTVLQPVFHMGGFLGEGSALFEIRDVADDTDMLISNGGLGAALAATLGSRSAVLMRGHGSTVVGSSIEQAVYRAYYAEVNARLQLQAKQLGEVTYLNAKEAAKGDEAMDLASALARKQVHDAAAYIRGLATMRGRNAEWAERAVREAVEAGAPDLVLNAAAYNAVDRAETEREAAYRANAPGGCDAGDLHVADLDRPPGLSPAVTACASAGPKSPSRKMNPPAPSARCRPPGLRASRGTPIGARAFSPSSPIPPSRMCSCCSASTRSSSSWHTPDWSCRES